ncbi:hypothetical protein [Pseudomonas sp. RT6P73]
MSTEKNQVPVPVILEPVEGSLVTHPVWVRGTAEAGGTVRVVKANGSVFFFEYQVGGDGRWEGDLPKDLNGKVDIAVCLIKGNESSAWVGRKFSVE